MTVFRIRLTISRKHWKNNDILDTNDVHYNDERKKKYVYTFFLKPSFVT